MAYSLSFLFPPYIFPPIFWNTETLPLLFLHKSRNIEVKNLNNLKAGDPTLVFVTVLNMCQIVFNKA